MDNYIKEFDLVMEVVDGFDTIVRHNLEKAIKVKYHESVASIKKARERVESSALSFEISALHEKVEMENIADKIKNTTFKELKVSIWAKLALGGAIATLIYAVATFGEIRMQLHEVKILKAELVNELNAVKVTNSYSEVKERQLMQKVILENRANISKIMKTIKKN